MNITCKVADESCPRRLTICCGVCEHLHTCDDSCDCHDFEKCPDAEIITEDLVAFKSAVPDTIQKITTLIRMKKEVEDQEKLLKQKLVEAMEAHGIKSFETDQIKMVYVAPTTRSTIDSNRLKKDHPDIVEQYTKISDVSASVRVTVK